MKFWIWCGVLGFMWGAATVAWSLPGWMTVGGALVLGCLFSASWRKEPRR